MSDPKTMDWSPGVWQGLVRALGGMPLGMRRRALEMVVGAAETSARGRGAACVEAADVVAGARQQVPAVIRPLCLAALREQGIE